MENIQEIRNPFEEELIDSGYKFFKDNLKKSLRGIQKRYEDEKGTRYFITLYHYNYAEQGILGEDSLDRYSVTTQFRIDKKGKDQTLDLNFTADFLINQWRPITTIQEVEEFFEKMFQCSGADYYELNDEEE